MMLYATLLAMFGRHILQHASSIGFDEVVQFTMS